jgi:hypothetical protein
LFSLYTILGVEENSSPAEVEFAFRQLCAEISKANFKPESLGEKQAAQCLKAFENAFNTLSNPELKKQYELAWQEVWQTESPAEIQPKMGQLCVASGMITLQELEEVVKSQPEMDLPLGQMLLENKLISQAELDGLLLGQQLISLPPDTPHSLGQRLIALGLVSEDMVRIALIEQRTFGRRIGELLVEHEWVDKDIIEILMAQAKARGKAQS